MEARTLLIIAGAILLIAAAATGGYVTYTHFKQRGIRNNNPGNLTRTTIAWKGKVPLERNTDSRFEQFQDFNGVPGHIWGLRAMFMDLRGDVFKDGLNTIEKLIASYAPPTENDTRAYIAAVAKSLGKSATAPLQPADMLPLMQAITQHENGVNPYPAADFQRAMALA